MFMIKLIFIFLLTFIFIGCNSNKNNIGIRKINKYPVWYTVPKDNKQFIFSLGTGIDKDSAVANALKNAISKLSVSIESSIEINKTLKNGRYNRDIKQNIKTSISKININNYKIINFKRIKYNEFIVKIQIDKYKLASYLKDKLSQEVTSLLQIEKNLYKYNYIQQLVEYKNIYNKLNQKLSMLYIISSLDKTFNIDYYKNLINVMHDKYLDKESNAKVTLIYSKNIKEFANSLNAYLTSRKISIVKNSDLKIFLSIDKTNSTNKYFNIIIYTVNLKAVYNNMIVGNKKYEIKLPNKGNTKRLNEKASEYFLRDIEKQSLMNAFSLK